MAIKQTTDEEPVNYVQLDFGNHRPANTNHNPPIPVISPPSRLSRYEQQKQQIDKYFVRTAIEQPSSTPSSIVNNPDPLTKIRQANSRTNEDPRDFATFLCIFASIMTTVLVLMFYIVGETAFRLILMVISFVSILTLCLACFFRRPTLIIIGNHDIVHGFGDNLNQQSINSQPYLLISPTIFGKNYSHPTANSQQL